MAGNPACNPPDRSNSPYHQRSNETRSGVTERWEDRWGAFALDMETGLGVAKNMRSKRAAQNAAMAECKRKGGKGCRIELAYYNQCGVMVAGQSSLNVAAAATVERGTEIGMELCGKAGDGGCALYFSDCSPPVLVTR
ncbi:DUF4189 domain-containing protein [Lysobacter gummosus]|uniref:DUF4189 domain-containing protein n=2 Tax=Lysobacter gummosus TaxID=262324 RepID=UPI00363AAAA3